jgi:hypothetical protein
MKNLGYLSCPIWVIFLGNFGEVRDFGDLTASSPIDRKLLLTKYCEANHGEPGTVFFYDLIWMSDPRGANLRKIGWVSAFASARVTKIIPLVFSFLLNDFSYAEAG